MRPRQQEGSEKERIESLKHSSLEGRMGKMQKGPIQDAIIYSTPLAACFSTWRLVAAAASWAGKQVDVSQNPAAIQLLYIALLSA